jgi:hypothetical protein
MSASTCKITQCSHRVLRLLTAYRAITRRKGSVAAFLDSKYASKSGRRVDTTYRSENKKSETPVSELILASLGCNYRNSGF